MNERIKELAEQAGWYIVDDDEHSTYFGKFAEKFAELIVRECIGIIENNNPCPPGTNIIYSLTQDEYFDRGWQVAVETKSNQIQKHFGVEE